jgi:hypothetical protein
LLKFVFDTIPSLLRRLPPPPGEKPFLNEIQPDMHPLEILYDVKKLMHEENVKSFPDNASPLSWAHFLSGTTFAYGLQ